MKCASFKNYLIALTILVSTALILRHLKPNYNGSQFETRNDHQGFINFSTSFNSQYLPLKPFTTATYQPSPLFTEKLDAKPKEFSSKNTEIRVIISSMGRSGSSMLGEIISTFDPNTFYVFEPLYSVQSGGNLSYNLANEMLQDILDCNLTSDITVEYLQNWPHSHRTFANSPYGTDKSLQYYRKILSWTRRKAMEEQCRRSQFKVIKVIRLPLMSTKEQTKLLSLFLRGFEYTYVIMLHRDPRATFYSRTNKVSWPGNVSTEKLCSRQLRLFNTGDLLMNGEYSERVKSMKYEDIVLNPTKEISLLFEFLKMSMPDSTLKWIRSNMQQSTQKEEKENLKAKNLKRTAEPYRTDRKDSKSLIKQWNEKDITIGTTCKELIHKLGYS